MNRVEPKKGVIFVDTRPIFNYHIKIFKLFGLWPPKNPTNLNRWHTFLAFINFGYGFMLTLILTFAFLKSLNGIIDNLLIFSIVLLITIKGSVLYYRKPKILEIFGIFDELNEQIRTSGEAVFVNEIIRECRLLLKIIISCYLSAYTFLAVFNLIADIDNGFWPSTAFYPYEFAQLKWVYWSVFIYQGVADFVMCLTGTAVDTFGVFLSNILGSHLEVLRYKLRALGMNNSNNENDNQNRDFGLDLITCIENHKKCLQ